MKTTNQGNRVGGAIALGFGIAMMVIMIVAEIIMGTVAPEQARMTLMFSILSVGILGLPMIILGLVMLIKGSKAAAIKRDGHKSTCVVFNVLPMRYGTTLIVTYKGNSGTEYRHSLPIGYRAAQNVCPGMVIECYIQGEDCFVDEHNIVEVKED